jgi:probable rRNA maturation factor
MRWITDTKSICSRLLGKLGIEGWEVSVLFCDDKLMTKLNGEYRHMDRTTDVLSFRQDDDRKFPRYEDFPHIAGDIVISIDTLKRNAASRGVDKKIELVRLLIHAVLHLHGMDHDTTNRTMIEKQEKLLVELGYTSV